MDFLEKSPSASPSKKLTAAFFPLLVLPFVFFMVLSHDRRISFLVLAGLFSAIAFLAHRKRLHVAVRLALIAGAVGAGAAAWIFGIA